MKRSLMPVVLSALCSMVNAADWSSRPLSELAVHPEFRALASVEPRDEAQLSAEVAGRVTALPARIGERIGKGAMVARIDDRQYRIEVRQAQAQLSVMDNRIRIFTNLPIRSLDKLKLQQELDRIGTARAVDSVA